MNKTIAIIALASAAILPLAACEIEDENGVSCKVVAETADSMHKVEWSTGNDAIPEGAWCVIHYDDGQVTVTNSNFAFMKSDTLIYLTEVQNVN